MNKGYFCHLFPEPFRHCHSMSIQKVDLQKKNIVPPCYSHVQYIDVNSRFKYKSCAFL